MSFVHLHVHSEYSLLDGLPSVQALAQAAKTMDMPALALTDHGVMYGAVAFYQAAKKAGIKPILGIEAYLAGGKMTERSKENKETFHLLLLAQNETGYKNLLKLATAAQLEGFYYKPRIDHDILAQHNHGLIATTGCLSGEIPRAIQRGDMKTAREKMAWYRDVFGRERFFVELQSHKIPELPEINRTLIALAKEFGLRLIATNDVHYIKPEDARLQDVLIAIQTGKLLTDPKRMQMTDDTYYLRSPQEMAEIFAEVPEAIRNTLLVAEMCNVHLRFANAKKEEDKGKYILPAFPVPEGYDAESYLRHLCEEGLRRRYGEAGAQTPEVRQRLEHELGIIHTMGFDAYFLIVWDLVEYARKQGIWFNARGSAAGSLVAYALGITMVDPLEHGLIFERFLNPGRVSMPDIDLDFQDDRRDEMMRYCALKYGEDKVAQIITFGTMKARAAVRDVGRVMDIPLSEVDKVAKLIPNIPGKPVSLDEVLGIAAERETDPEKRREKEKLVVPELVALYRSRDEAQSYFRELLDTARAMEGVVRNVGTHAAGVIITDQPAVEYVPLHRPTSNDPNLPIKKITQYEMSILEALGLLKVDFLGLSTLTVMARACELIAQRHGKRYDLYNIPTDDPEAYRLLSEGRTAGVFQVEGQGMTRNLMEMKPTKLEHVIAMIALYRPGPLEFIPSYIRRMHGQEKPTYLHPKLEPIFRETFGIAVYQEQIMFAAMELAGYNASEADDLRKAIAKKKKKELLKHQQKFVKGAVANGIARETAEAIFHNWLEFARYGFNKSHAADYGVIAVQTAFLKAHYPAEFMAATMSVTKHDTDKIAFYVADCQQMGIPVLPPSVNASGWDFTIEGTLEKPAIRFALGAIKNVGQGPVDAILEARGDHPFTGLTDFVHRVDLRKVTKRALESLIKAGALDDFGDRQDLLASLDHIMAVNAAHFRAKEIGQLSLFGQATGVTETIKLHSPTYRESRLTVLSWERELTGTYLSEHPLTPVRPLLEKAITHTSRQLADAPPNHRVWVGGMITDRRRITTKKGDEMGFASLEDLEGHVELVLFPRTWEQYATRLEPGKVVLVYGRVDAYGGSPKILVEQVETNLNVVRHNGDVVAIKRPAPPPRPKKRASPPPQPPKPTAEETSPEPPQPLTPPPDNGGEAPPPPSSPPAVGKPPPPEPSPEGWLENAPPKPPAALQPTAAPQNLPLAVAVAEPSGDYAVALPETPEPSSEPLAEAVEDPPAPPPTTEAAPPPNDAPPAAPPAEERTATKEDASPSNAPPTPPPDETSSPLPSTIPLPDAPRRRLVVTLRASDDPTRDALRVSIVHQHIIAYPGDDRFAFYLLEHGHAYLVEFPEAIQINEPLLNWLQTFVGAENVRVEPLP